MYIAPLKPDGSVLCKNEEQEQVEEKEAVQTQAIRLHSKKIMVSKQEPRET